MGTPKPFGYVYLVTNNVTGKCYVGQTVKTVAQRWGEHVKHAAKSKVPSGKSIAKHGKDAFTVREIDTAVSREDLDNKETRWIAFYDTVVPKGYNLSVGGKGRSGMPLTPEHKARISAALKGRERSPEHCASLSTANKGGTRTPEHKARISAGLRGHTHTTEARAKISFANKGKLYTPEVKARISATLTGRTLTPEHRDKIIAGMKTHSPEAKTKMSASHRGKHHTPETKAKISASNKARALAKR